MFYENEISKLETIIEYNFKDKSLLLKSLVHRSYLAEKNLDPRITENNERLEFLGDAVLELVVTNFLYVNFNEDEGYLTSLRSSLVNYKSIGQVGINLGLEEVILISHGEKAELGKARLTIVADCVEAILGAIYLDDGIQASTNFVYKFIVPQLDSIIQNKSYKDPKTLLQETVQKAIHVTPKYQLIKSIGKDHDKIFKIGLYIFNNLLALGEGKTKQDAQTQAAATVLKLIETQEVDLQQLLIDSQNI